MFKYFQKNRILFFILVITFLGRVINLDYPKTYVFDEVYHAFTAKEFVNGNKEAWGWWTKPPPGVAFEWTHPPLAKEIMAFSMIILHTDGAWAWRIPGIILGVLSVYLTYLLTLTVLKDKTVALISAFLFSIDGLNFVQSRTGMNDIYMVTFALASLLFFLNKKYFLSSLLFGLSFASKWSGIYLLLGYLIIGLYYLFPLKLEFSKLAGRLVTIIKVSFYFLTVPILIYFLSYLPFFTLGHTFNQFIQLQQQMWWYHTGLKAAHNYSSSWWSWPLNLYPVWYFVDYKGDKIANIFTSGNPILFWLASVAFVFTIWEAIKTRSKKLFIIILGFSIFWLPWALSPRIMFLYHFSPSVPFICIALGYQLGISLRNYKNRKIVYLLLGLCTVSFILIFPFLTGIALPKELVKWFFVTNITKNPFF